MENKPSVIPRNSLINPKVAILDCAGRLVIGEVVPLLKERIDELLDDDRELIVINLTQVTEVDSSGIGQLVSSYTSVKHEGGRIRFLCPNKRIQDELKVMHLDTVFKCHQSEEDAVASFGGGC